MSRALPVLGAPTVDAAMCGACGGSCCKTYPGIATPEDFGAPEIETMRTRLRAALDSGRWAIDWWEGDPRTLEDRGDTDWLSQAEFVRPAMKGHEGERTHPGRRGQCTFFKAGEGCALEHDARPRNCRGLVPKYPACSEKHPDGEFVTKDDYVRSWLPYLSLLQELANE